MGGYVKILVIFYNYISHKQKCQGLRTVPQTVRAVSGGLILPVGTIF